MKTVLFLAAAALAFRPAPASAQNIPWNGDVFSALNESLATMDPPAAPNAVLADDTDARPRALFAKPLIVGASVSSDLKTASPGRLLARRFGTEAAINLKAWPGTRGSQIVERLKDSDFAAATVVIAVDLFFWDSIRSCRTGPKAVETFIKMAAKNHSTVVLGNVPVIPRVANTSATRCRDTINRAIKKSCAHYAGCVLLDNDAWWSGVLAEGGGVFDERFYSPKEYFCKDRLHLSGAGSKIVAHNILTALAEAPLASR